MFEIWQPVKVTNEEHPRHGEAGTVQAIDPAHPDEVGVKFDADGQVQALAIADLKGL